MRNIIILLIVLLLTGCKGFDEFQEDPNRTGVATPGLLLTNLEVHAFNSISLDAALASRYLVNINLANEFQYFNWTRGSYNNYNLLRQVIKIEEEATKTSDLNYLAIAKFFRAFLFDMLCKQFGEVPYFSALQGEKEVFNAEYDTQESIYIDLLRLLKEANEEISVIHGAIAGDVVYNGNHLKWRKLINSYRLRILINLSAKTGNTKLNIINEFKEIIENPDKYPIMTSSADNCALMYSFSSGNNYPFYEKAYIQTAHIMEESFINRLKSLSDPRLFVMADQEKRGESGDIHDFSTYGGLRGCDPIDTNTERTKDGEGSPIDIRYIKDPEAEPNLTFGYAETLFIIAEAAQRRWITHSPEQYYINGIKASMDYYKINDVDVTNYLNNPKIKFNDSEGLKMILIQKHTAMFLNSGWEPFYNQRRTGIPEIDVSGAGMMNEGKIPKRWMYPNSEIELNLKYLEESIVRQYGKDDINGEMWLLKAE